MKTRSHIALLAIAASCLLPALSRAETLAWWRLSEDQPPQRASEGGPDLKWWSASKNPYVAVAAAPPATLYRISIKPEDRSFAAAASCLDKEGGLIAANLGDWSDVSAGLTVEGFFKTTRKKTKLENQAIVTCGEGWMDASWAVRLMDGRLTLAVFQDNDKFPVAQVEAGDDLRDDKWHFFAARLIPAASGKPGKLTLTVTSEDGTSVSEETDLPAGLTVRQNKKPLIVGRSSLYIDNKPEYCGTWDTFQGLISDIRISKGVLKDSDLLGAIKH